MLNKEEIYKKVANKEMTADEALKYLERLHRQTGDMEQPFQDDLEAFPPKGETSYPLSEGQKALWIIYRLAPQNYAYNCPAAFLIDKDIDIEVLENAMQDVLDSHPSLRTVICMEEGTPVQVVKDREKLCIHQEDISGLSRQEVLSRLREEARKPFDLLQGPLLSARLFKTQERDNILLLNFHHIMVDGISISIFWKHLQQCYMSRKTGERYGASAARASYRDFVYWQKKMLESEEGQQHRDYWLHQLSGRIPALNLQLNRPHPALPAYCGESCTVRIEGPLFQKLKELSLAKNVTLFSMMLAAFKVLLYRYSMEEDILVGTPVAGRPEARFENVMGYFVNMVVIKSSLSGEISFEAFMEQVHKTAFDALEHSDYPFFSLVEELRKIKNDSSLQPFQAAFYFQNWIGDMNEEASCDGIKDAMLLRPLNDIRQEGEFDLTLEVMENQDDLVINLKYNTDLLEESMIRRMAEHYLRIVRSAAKSPRIKLSEIPMLTEEEMQLLEEWNHTDADYPRDKCVHDLFAEQAAKTPEAIAVTYEGMGLTYGELNARADRLAAFLHRLGVKPGTLVGILMERSIEMVTALLGVLKVGGAYVPLDPHHPEERLSYMIEDSRLAVLITQSTIDYKPGGCSAEIISLDTAWESIMGEDAEAADPWDPCDRVNPEALAYVIYTSGSTGKPKGVQVLHRGLSNFLCSMAEYPGFSQQDVMLAVTTICFDIAGLELYLPLIKGGRVEILPAHLAVDGTVLREKLENSDVTVMQATPATWQILIDAGWKGKKAIRILCGGEELSGELAQKLLQRGKEVWNLYGPTETTIWSTVSRVKQGEKLSIGRPIANTKVYILDKSNKIVPSGVPGEMFIGGDGLARGYLGRPELTAEKFIPNPFLQGEKMYRTGDLARWLPDGNIEFIGRMDNQVKIRGFRIELGEIEAQLLRHERIREAVVIAREDKNAVKFLCAYLVAEGEPTVVELRKYLSKNLPDYMIPAYFIRLKKMPLTPNGKIDRKALPKPDESIDTGTQYVSPKSRLEIEMTGIWKEVLGRERIGITDNFFDIGGNSISIVRVNSLMNQLLKNERKEEISVIDMFNYPTIDALLKSIHQGEEDDSHRQEERKSQLSTSKALLDRSFKRSSESFGKTPHKQTGLEIAVIGMAGRFPGAGTLKEFWDNLKSGVESITFFSDEGLIKEGIAGELLSNPNYVKAKGILQDVEYFDASFFGYTPADVEVMDPQMRIFHECVWEALENAGYNPYTYKGSIGLYGSSSNNMYWEALNYLSLLHKDTASQFNAFQFVSRDFLCSRISYKLNLRGPSMLVQTACSSSLAAVHAACQKLLAGGCHIAVAGGVSVSLPQKNGYLYQDGMILSPDGHCRTFDEQANGTVIGEGAGVVVLKRLEDAAADGDTILAIIKGSEVNNDGSEKIGYTAPSIEGQCRVIEAAYHLAEIEPETVSYIEAHGTGTALGDPIEVEALKKAFHTFKRNFCSIGSVKTNIGHLDAAAGVAGLIKTVLSLKNRQIPPSLHYTVPNPKIDFDNSPFYVNSTLRAWEREGHPLRAGVSSFGIGGTNVHVVLEEAPEQETAEAGRGYQLMVLSAKTPTALDRMSQNLSEYLTENPDVCLADAAYTLQVGRAEFQYRRAFAASSVTEAIGQLARPFTPEYIQENGRKVVFMFPGQGSQYTKMGQDLYEKEPVFREEMDRCFDIVKPMLPIDIKEVLYPESNTVPAKITDTLVTQPLIFSFEYSLAKLLMSIGIKPHVMIGHSLGEYTAACLAGVFSLEDALSLVVERGKLMQQLPEGAMLSVPLTEEELKPFLTEELALAAVNSTSLCVISGSNAAVTDLEERLWKQGHQGIKLPASKAFHSKGMDPVIEAFAQKMKGMKLGNPQITYLSNVTGSWITAEEATNPAYWGRHLSETVRFAEGMAEILKEEDALLLEVGPGWALNAAVKQHEDYREEHVAVNLTRYEQEEVAERSFQQLLSNMIKQSQEELDDRAYLFNQLGKLWCAGLAFNWELLHKDEKRRRIPLPTYPFERQRYWMDGNLFEQVKHHTVSLGFKEIGRNSRDQWMYTPLWKKAEPSHKGTSDGPKSCMVFINDHPFVETITHRLKQEFNELFVIKSGSKYARENDHCYQINPCEKEDYLKVLLDLKKKGHSPQLMVHLWNVTGDLPACISTETVWKRQEEGFYSLVYLTQAVTNSHDLKNIEIMAVSDHLQDITGDAVDYSKSTIPAACKVINQECSNIHCKSIDIDIPEGESAREAWLLDHLMLEFSTRDSEVVVAYRNNRRWAPAFELINPDAVGESEGIPLKEKGVYLITGGLGNIGLVFADYLVRKYSAKIVLLGRSEFPPKKEWEEWLDSHDPDDTISKRIRKIKELEALGGEVLVCKADLSNSAQLLDTVNAIEEKLGKINGVFHAAGIVAAHLISEITREDCEEYFQAKIYGLLGLYEVFKNKEIDFCMLMSSLSPILGGLGFLAYAASNSFMDAFAAGLEKKKNWFSINWEGWSFHGDALAGGPIGKEEAGLSLRPAEGLGVFEQLLKLSKTNPIIVSTGSLQERYKKWVHLKKDKKPEGTKKEKAKPEMPRPNVTTAYAALRGETEERLGALWQEILGYSGIGRDDNFFELGANSLMAIMLVSKIHKEFSVSMPLGHAFKTPTIAQMSTFIEEATNSSYVSIPKAELREYYPMSAAQKRIYILDRMEGVGTAYSMSFLSLLEGDVDTRQFEETFKALIQRHDAFRTSFHMVDGEPVQKIHGEIEFSVLHREISEDQIKDLEKEFVKAFDLSRAPLLRVCLAKTGAGKHVMMVDMHHIISDGVSLDIIVKEFMAAYKGMEWKPKGLEYKDYSLWQRELLAGEGIKEQEEYWLDTLKGDLPVLNMPYDYPRPPIQSFEGDTVKFLADREVTQKLHDLAKEKGTTLYMVLLAAFNVLLYKYTGQEDIVIGSPIAGRRHDDLQDIVGLFVNTLALRNYPADSKTFTGFLEEVKDNALKGYENQDYQFEELVEKLDIKRDLGRNPLFDVMFALHNADDIHETSIGNITFKPYALNTGISKLDLTLEARETDGNILCSFEYCTRLFKKETIKGLAKHYIRILEEILKLPDVALCDIEMLSEEEKHRILFDFNDTAAEYPKDKTLCQLFEEQVERTPDHFAAVFEDKHLTYRELNEKSNQLARILMEKGVKPDDAVGIMVERSLEMIIGLMGILKAGGAYLALDPEFPNERIKYSLEDAQVKLLLTQAAYSNLEFEGETIRLDDEKLFVGDTGNVIKKHGPGNLAYIVYTSGSTGRPKGIMVEHRNVVHVTTWFAQCYDLTKNKNVLQMSNYIFDPSVEQIFGTLLSGATLYCLKKETMLHREQFLAFIKKNEINVADFTPGLLRELLLSEKKIESLHVVICGGEKLDTNLKNAIMDQGYVLYDHYGPSEITVDAIAGKCTKGAQGVIGKPISNTRIYILDQNNRLKPIGVNGEICISGSGVARGYVGDPELTARKFVPSPFLQGERMYRTGDLAKWLSDGNIEFIGRMDDQVKIRGFRIEPGEIEAQLLRHERIKEAVVMAREDKNAMKYLCAYIAAEGEPSAAELKQYLSTHLPDYMIPAYFIPVEKMPLTFNGKIDRKALPEPDGNGDPGTPYVAPKSRLEIEIAAIWQEVLGREHIGIKDNFFDIGGNSLSIVRVNHLINQLLREELQEEISVIDMFQYPTIDVLLQKIRLGEERDFERKEERKSRLTKSKALLDRSFKRKKGDVKNDV